MLKPKKYIQRSVRVEERLLEDLGVLSAILGRSQSELINVAIEKLLQENKKWFALNIIVDNLCDFVEMGMEEDSFSMQGLSINLKYVNDKITADVTVKSGDEIADEFTKEFDDMDSLVKELRVWVHYLDQDSPEIQRYLDEKLDYR